MCRRAMSAAGLIALLLLGGCASAPSHTGTAVSGMPETASPSTSTRVVCNTVEAIGILLFF